jgi:hypothetical protein
VDDSGDDNVDDDDETAEKSAGQKSVLARVVNKIIDNIERSWAAIEAQNARIAALESQPLPGGPVLHGARTISKSEDAGGARAIADSDPVKAFGKHLDTLPADERALALMKFTLANPLPHAPGR